MGMWIGGNSRGNLTFGIATGLRSRGQRDDDGCIPQALGCAGSILWFAALGALCWFVGTFVLGVFSA
jgi:hypothetical protein